MGHSTYLLIQAGQESFKSITRSYYRNAIGAVVVYDVTSRESFNHIQKWIEEVKESGNEVIQFILVGNKCDLTNKLSRVNSEGKLVSRKD